MNEESKLVTLRNGQAEVAPLVTVTMIALEDLLSTAPILFYELVMACRDKNHELFGNAGEELLKRKLMERMVDGTYSVHESVKNIVLSATKGDGMDMRLITPFCTM